MFKKWGRSGVTVFLPDSYLLQLRGISTFPILRLYEYFRQVFPIIATSGDLHLRTFAIFEGSLVVAGFLPDFHPLQLRGVTTLPILRLYEYFRKVFPESSLPTIPFFELSLF